MVDRQVKLIYAEVKVGDDKIPLLTLHTLLYSKMKMESRKHTKCSTKQNNIHDGPQKRIRENARKISSAYSFFLRIKQYQYNQQENELG